MHSTLRPVFVINPVKMEQGGGSDRAEHIGGKFHPLPLNLTPHSGRNPSGGDVKDIHALLCRQRRHTASYNRF